MTSKPANHRMKMEQMWLYLRCFARTRFTNDHQHLVLLDGLQQFLLELEDGQRLTLLSNGHFGRLAVRQVLRLSLLPLREVLSGL